MVGEEDDDDDEGAVSEKNGNEKFIDEGIIWLIEYP